MEGQKPGENKGVPEQAVSDRKEPITSEYDREMRAANQPNANPPSNQEPGSAPSSQPAPSNQQRTPTPAQNRDDRGGGGRGGG
jgi:hypothetical protein